MRNSLEKYFECKVKYVKMQEDGKEKKASEQYVVSACSFGEAEKRITESLSAYIQGEFDVTDIKIASFGEIIDGTGDGDKFFKAKVTFIALDESCGKEKCLGWDPELCKKDAVYCQRRARKGRYGDGKERSCEPCHNEPGRICLKIKHLRKRA